MMIENMPMSVKLQTWAYWENQLFPLFAAHIICIPSKNPDDASSGIPPPKNG